MSVSATLTIGRELEAVSSGKAIKHYSAATAIYPDEAEVWLRLAASLRRKGRSEELRAALKQAWRCGASAAAIAQLSPLRKDPEAFLKAAKESPEDMEVRMAIGPFLRNHFDKFEPQSLEIADALTRFPLPDSIRIETASACNLRCGHCTTGVAYDSTDRRVMRLETFERIIGQMQRLPSLKTATMYLGGEPLLNKHHALMCRRVKEETSVKVTKFVTNGMLLSQAWCDRLVDANVDMITISVDGLSREQSDQIRSGSDFEIIRKNILALKETFDRARVSTRIVIGNTQFRKAGQSESDLESAEFLRKEFKGIPIDPNWAMVWPGMQADEVGIDDLVVETSTPLNFCDHPFRDFAVRANGDVVLCCYDISGRHVMGNVARDDLLDLFESEAYVALRSVMLRRAKEELPAVCQRCAVYTGAKFIRY